MTVADLGPKGRNLWSDLCERVEGQRGLVLLEEACRIADRLDRLDALLLGDPETWVRVDGTVLVVDSALAEARAQASVLQRLLASLPLQQRRDDADDWLDELPTTVRDS